MARRFADQFAPFVAAGWSVDERVDARATYIRVPLRTATQASRQTALAPFGVHLEAARDALAAFAARVHATLLFSNSVDRVVVSARFEEETEEKEDVLVDVFRENASEDVSDARVGSDAKPKPARVTPRTVEEDAEWRRSSLSAFFGGAANATRCSHVVTLVETRGSVDFFSEKSAERSGDAATRIRAKTVDEWIVGAAIGVGKARELALDRQKARRLHDGTLLPLARVASHVRRDGVAVDPSRAPPAPAAAALAAVAARAVAEGRTAPPAPPRPGAGLFALGAPVPPRTFDSAGDPVASALRRAPGVIDAHFATKRGAASARFVEFLDPRMFRETGVLRANKDAAKEDAKEDAKDVETLETLNRLRREWNRALCACVVAANVEVIAHARTLSGLNSEPLPAVSFYGLWPRSVALGAPPPPALDAEGRPIEPKPTEIPGSSSSAESSFDALVSGGHPASALYVRPLYKALAEHAPGLFRSLGTAAPTKPADGYFLPAGFAEGAGFGGGAAGTRTSARPLAARFIAEHFPVIDAPAEIRPELAAAGAGGAAKELTAAALRRLLRAKPPPASEPTRVHVELLECATSDVLAEESSRSAEAPSAYPAPPTDSLTGIVDAMAAAGVPLNQWLGAAGLGTAEATPPRGANGDANGDGNGDSTVRDSHPPLDLAAARDLAGVPVPTASGETRPIGNGVLYAGTETMVSLAPRLRGRFLHPSLIADSKTLAPLLRHPRFNAATNTCVFGFDELLAELPRSLPARLAPAKIAGLAVVRWREEKARAPEAPSSLAARDEGDSRFAPSPAWLRAFWDALAPREVLAMTGGERFDWTNAGKFDEWPLVPCESETLVRVKHAGAVFVAPDFVDERRRSTDPAASDDPEDERRHSTNVPTTNDVTRDLPNFHDGSNRLAKDWHWLAPALRAARFPVLDTRAGGAACAAATRAAARPMGAGLMGTIQTPADAFVWKLMCASEQFGDASSGLPFDFAKTSTAFRTRLFETLVSQFETSDLLRTPPALEAVKTHLPIFFRAERQKRVFAGDEKRVLGDETLVSHSETDSTVETTHPHHTTREKIWVSLRSTHTHFTTCPPDVPFAEASYRSPETLAYVAAALPLYRALGVEVLDDAATLARHVVPRWRVSTRRAARRSWRTS